MYIYIYIYRHKYTSCELHLLPVLLHLNSNSFYKCSRLINRIKILLIGSRAKARQKHYVYYAARQDIARRAVGETRTTRHADGVTE